MTPEERFFLERIAPIDWATPRWELEKRHGRRSYHGWAEVVTLPPAWLGLVFSMYAEPGDLPPEHLFADWRPHDDARANHAAIEARIAAELGPGASVDAVNCLGRTWRFGVFEVGVRTWPPELQRGRNTLIERAPELAVRSVVTLSSDYSWVFPDESLAKVGEGAVPVAGRLARSLRASRRNPEGLVVAGVIGWRDGDRVGASNARDSLVLPRQGKVAVERVRGGPTADRSTLEVAGQTLLEADGWQALDAAGAALAKVWDLPLVVRDVGLGGPRD